ncbi:MULTISPECIES: DMT family transporter [Clostridium]|uniref:DMT family transporter n=2 Tax=Clostridium TaxID=1485 RepID=A0A1S9MYT7_CLOBE|nr:MULTISPECIES: DMT family transporter [Clostridium]MBN7577237.1 DMT family transporter [Clostridium beijerinckii]MBN7582123.1 DMT family transporter [Clostridium beijerinckii]MBN7587003.1 DMT family transporter [Clostridium beijerinckii]MBO0523175.1 DMT family transporter [Clostridium beijerinckii]MZK52939.1 EamA-like transporter family protein [Clostridium beijerinckii]
MFGIICAIISGIAMSIQGVFNTRLGEKIGVWETTLLVQIIALILSLIIFLFLGDGNYSNLKDSNKLYLLGGALGVVITFTVIKSVSSMGPTFGIGIILISQLLAAALIDAFGLFGSERLRFSLNHFLGIAIMIAGIVIFKWNH